MNRTSERILDAIGETGSYDPHVVAKAVIAGLKRTEYVGALEDALPALVRVVHGQLRNSPPLGPTGSESQPPTAEGADQDDANPVAAPAVLPRRPGRSRYAAWTGLFARPYGTGNGYKPLGDLTRDDVQFVIADRLSRAQACNDEAERFRKLDDLLRKRKADKVGDLPESDVGGCFQ